jgi:hypothetical protein
VPLFAALDRPLLHPKGKKRATSRAPDTGRFRIATRPGADLWLSFSGSATAWKTTVPCRWRLLEWTRSSPLASTCTPPAERRPPLGDAEGDLAPALGSVFWQPNEDFEDNVLGECRLRAPAFNPLPLDPAEPDTLAGLPRRPWPLTEFWDWCAELEAGGVAPAPPRPDFPSFLPPTR